MSLNGPLRDRCRHEDSGTATLRPSLPPRLSMEREKKTRHRDDESHCPLGRVRGQKSLNDRNCKGRYGLLG